MAYNSLPFTCPKCFANSGISHLKHKGPITRRLRQCTGCSRKFYTLDLGNGEIFDCWHIEGQNRATIEYREKVLNFRRMAKVALKAWPGATTDIALTHARQELGIPTPLKQGSRQD
jgi:hypothetical protein